ncbi:hypothetical protein B9Z55_025353 [Caenorhabditis nigoni]|uniref:Uncharacterized protein n=1 Tax=Caenorhabditis nigoni TaxID=1611254 RepID=A0A2G5SYU0_9PELO|nr:hypothetical protein B9Z55_025353 [Caenorhabditis nigoni]
MENAIQQPRNMPDNELVDPEIPQETLLLFREIKMIGEMLYVIGCEPRSRNGMDIIEDLYVDFWQLYLRLIQHNARLIQELFNN